MTPEGQHDGQVAVFQRLPQGALDAHPRRLAIFPQAECRAVDGIIRARDRVKANGAGELPAGHYGRFGRVGGRPDGRENDGVEILPAIPLVAGLFARRGRRRGLRGRGTGEHGPVVIGNRQRRILRVRQRKPRLRAHLRRLDLKGRRLARRNPRLGHGQEEVPGGLLPVAGEDVVEQAAVLGPRGKLRRFQHRVAIRRGVAVDEDRETAAAGPRSHGPGEDEGDALAGDLRGQRRALPLHLRDAFLLADAEHLRIAQVRAPAP